MTPAIRNMLLGRLPTMDEIIENSFKDYHVRGFDYLCLRRTPTHTVKVYLFEGDVGHATEVVNPHDHRYDFTTHVLAGEVSNFLFEPVASDVQGHPLVRRYERYDYLTPLNGGRGFQHAGHQYLWRHRRRAYHKGASYHMAHDRLHTIRITGSETALLLLQGPDKVRVGAPTTTYFAKGQPMPLTGLYSRFTPDEVINRLGKLERITGTSWTDAVAELKEAA